MNEATMPQKEDRAREQAQAQLESIVEMVAGLDRESAAKLYTSELSREKCIELLTSADIECYDHETIEELREAVSVNITDETLEPTDFEFDEDEVRQTIQEDPLSVQIRSGWYSPGETPEPAEFEILLCTGGPAVRIIGELDEHKQPDRARLQYQDWFTPWTEYFIEDDAQREALLAYCREFYYGE